MYFLFSIYKKKKNVSFLFCYCKILQLEYNRIQSSELHTCNVSQVRAELIDEL